LSFSEIDDDKKVVDRYVKGKINSIQEVVVPLSGTSAGYRVLLRVVSGNFMILMSVINFNTMG